MGCARLRQDHWSCAPPCGHSLGEGGAEVAGLCTSSRFFQLAVCNSALIALVLESELLLQFPEGDFIHAAPGESSPTLGADLPARDAQSCPVTLHRFSVRKPSFLIGSQDELGRNGTLVCC